MTPDDMARELRAAGWEEYAPGLWRHWEERRFGGEAKHAYRTMKELAQQRAQGTVQTPVVGTEEK